MFGTQLCKKSINMTGHLSMIRKIAILHKLSIWSCTNISPRTQILKSNFHSFGCQYSYRLYSNKSDFIEQVLNKYLSTQTWKIHLKKLKVSNICDSLYKKGLYSPIRRRYCKRTFKFGSINGGSVLCQQYFKPLTDRLTFALEFHTLNGCTGVSSTFKLRDQTFVSLTFSCHGYHTSSRTFSMNEVQYNSTRTKPPWRVLFFGTDLISLCTLKALHGNLISSGSLVDHLEVVTVRTQGQKGVPVYKFAAKAGLYIHEWPIQPSDHSNKYDVGVLVSFGHLIPERVIHLFPYGIINMHPSLLPRWRGASPIFHTVLNGDTETGVSISDIRPKHFDVGPILMQRSIPVLPCVTTGELTNQLADMGAEMVLDCLQDLTNLERHEHEQEPRGITYAHKVHPIKAGYVNWREESPRDIDHHFRAVQGYVSMATILPVFMIHKVHPIKAGYVYWREESPRDIDHYFRAVQGYGSLRLTSHLQNGEPVTFTEMVKPELTTDISTRDIQYRWGNFLEADPGCIALHRKEKWLLVKCKDGMVGFTKVVCRSHLAGSTFYYGFCNHKHSQLWFSSEDSQLNRYLYEKKIPVTV